MSVSLTRVSPTDNSFFTMWQDKVFSKYSDMSADYLQALIRFNHETPGFFVKGSNDDGAVLFMAYLSVMRVVGFLGLTYTVATVGSTHTPGQAMWVDGSASSYQQIFPSLIAFLRKE